MNAGGPEGEFADVISELTILTPEGELRTVTREEAGFRYRGWGLDDSIVIEAVLRMPAGDPVSTWNRHREYAVRKQKTQPLNDRSSGCVFKNPPGDSAGRLIDSIGLKGTSVGGARVSEQHANFIVATADATARDVLAVADTVRVRVASELHIDLDMELDVW